jgi:kinesin family protein 23
VFDTTAGQASIYDRVGLPLVTDLLQGKNGLLFTYGVTGSGKTHTMQGGPQDGGTLPRAIDVIFNSIDDMQTKKFQLKADKLNGFEIQASSDAALDRQSELVNNIRTPKRPTRSNNNSNEDLSNRIADGQKVNVNDDYQYAVFVSYVEIYNNYTYDLLDAPKMDIVSGRMKLTSKMLREDSYRNMYVHGAVEVEVKSPEEALETFYRGQKQRRTAETQLNLESSRSHSIFNIRVVAVPLDALGEDILSDSTQLVVSQLSLVDLAGSERTNRTGNTGARLTEASKINQSLMTLRTCIEVLRDNQNSGSSRAVPYRDSRVTHLFRNYFEGEGKVKMVVCVNPRASDYDENVNVMKFSEVTQEVVIERARVVMPDNGLTPGRRRANQVYKEAVRRLEEDGQDTAGLVMDLAPVYSLGPAWPPLEVTQFDQEEIIERLKAFLEKRLVTRKALLEDHDSRERKFRALLVTMEQEGVLLRAENKQLRTQLESERRRVTSLETKLVSAESANRSLTTKVAAYSETRAVLENELDDKELEVNQIRGEKHKLRAKYTAKLQREGQRVQTELTKEFTDREQRIREQGYKTQAKLNTLRNLVNDTDASNDENVENGAVYRQTDSDPNLTSLEERRRSTARGNAHGGRRVGSSSPTRRVSVAVANQRHRRSRSTDADVWLDHRPVLGGPLQSATILQPVLRKRRSVTKLEAADVVNEKANKYLLTTAEQDEEGEVTTKLYKVSRPLRSDLLSPSQIWTLKLKYDYHISNMFSLGRHDPDGGRRPTGGLQRRGGAHPGEPGPRQEAQLRGVPRHRRPDQGPGAPRRAGRGRYRRHPRLQDQAEQGLGPAGPGLHYYTIGENYHGVHSSLASFDYHDYRVKYQEYFVCHMANIKQ